MAHRLHRVQGDFAEVEAGGCDRDAQCVEQVPLREGQHLGWERTQLQPQGEACDLLCLGSWGLGHHLHAAPFQSEKACPASFKARGTAPSKSSARRSAGDTTVRASTMRPASSLMGTLNALVATP